MVDYVVSSLIDIMDIANDTDTDTNNYTFHKNSVFWNDNNNSTIPTISTTGFNNMSTLSPTGFNNMSTLTPSSAGTGESTSVLISYNDETIKSTTILYGGITCILLILYLFAVRFGLFRELLEPKGPATFKDILAIMLSSTPLSQQASTTNTYYNHESDFVSKCGLDAYLTLRNIKLCIRSLFGFMILTGVWLIPGYYHQQQQKEAIEGTTIVECKRVCRFSLANVPQNSNAQWLPVLGIIIMTMYLMYLLRNEYKEIVRIRASYWRSAPCEMFTILIDDLPAHLNLHTIDGIYNHFETLFPGDVLDVKPVRFKDETILDQLKESGKKRIKAYDRLTRWIALRQNYSHNLPACYPLFVKTPEDLLGKIVECENNFREMNEQFMQLRDKLEQMPLHQQTILSCFVTFKSARSAAVASFGIMDHRYNVVAELAPQPDDVLWDSLGYGAQSRSLYVYAVRVGFFILVVFWGAFVSMIGVLTSVEALEKNIPRVRDFFIEFPKLRELAAQSAPLLLSGMLAIVHPLISMMSRIKSRASESAADHNACIWNFAFLVIQVFIFYGVSNSLLETMYDIAYEPKKIVELLAKKIPGNASFYIQFILTKLVTSLCVDLWCISDLVLHTIRRCFLGPALTNRDKRIKRCGCLVTISQQQPRHKYLSVPNSNMLLLFFISTTYAVIQPLIIFVGLVYFILAYFVYAKLFLSVNTQRYDSSGTTWPRTYWCFVSAILTAQLTLIGILTLRTAKVEPSVVVVVVLFIGTCFMASMIDFRYRRMVIEIPYDLAAQVDAATTALSSGSTADEPHQNKEQVMDASIWQYGILTEQGRPNYFGRDIIIHQEGSDDEKERELLRLIRTSYTHGNRQFQGYYSYELPILREPRALEIPINLAMLYEHDDENDHNNNVRSPLLGNNNSIFSDDEYGLLTQNNSLTSHDGAVLLSDNNSNNNNKYYPRDDNNDNYNNPFGCHAEMNVTNTTDNNITKQATAAIREGEKDESSRGAIVMTMIPGSENNIQ